MNRPILVVSSITYAMKGQGILRQHGINSEIRRISKSKAISGCGYGLLIKNKVSQAETILTRHGIKVLDRMGLEGEQ